MASTSSNIIHHPLPKLNGKNYHHWSIQMRVLSESQDSWDIINQGIDDLIEINNFTEEQEGEIRELKKKDKKALYVIYQAVDEAVFERISTSETSKEAWDMLHRTYKGEEKVKTIRIQTLRCEFDGLKMKEFEIVEDFYNRTILVLNQLHFNGEIIVDRRVVEKILRSLTKKFEYVLVVIEESKYISVMSLERLLGILQSHELRMKQFDNPYEQAFQLQSPNPQERNIIQLREPQIDFKGRGKRIAKERENNFINIEDNEDTMFMILSTLELPTDDTWYMDSGCSNHMTGNKDFFTQLDKTHKKEVKTEDDKRDVMFEEGKGWNDPSSQEDNTTHILEEDQVQKDEDSEQIDHNVNSHDTPNISQNTDNTESLESSTESSPKRGYKSLRDIYNDPRSLDFNNTADFVLF
ncbi:uncharacterized protein LOC112527480 [Cynara cardunculus var. scolymus]|uniref:uncharacterized protein LOC112527480 n=1 Tax=Cynara cardunculus var. scolymus TaxID=59895 RepID=UPI000D630704|nr:uncharacterized protein LOC112527480 [Cynara cardunculus var. scolymus]